MWSDTTTKDTVFEINGKPKEMIQLTCFSKLVPREIKKRLLFRLPLIVERCTGDEVNASVVTLLLNLNYHT